MPLPYRDGATRAVPEWTFVDLYDPSFEPTYEEVVLEDGTTERREAMGFVTVALRPLIDVEVDKVERSPAFLDFMRRHFWGGFEIDGPNGKETVKDPMPLIVAGKPTDVDEDHVLVMFRTKAMQRAAIGQEPPVHPEGKPVTLVSVREMVDAAAGMADLFWKGLQAEMLRVWKEGQAGKGMRRTAPTSDAPPAA